MVLWGGPWYDIARLDAWCDLKNYNSHIRVDVTHLGNRWAYVASCPEETWSCSSCLNAEVTVVYRPGSLLQCLFRISVSAEDALLILQVGWLHHHLQTELQAS